MHWPSVLASANPLREGQRFVRPFRKKRWPQPLRPPQWRVLGFQNQAERAVRTVHSRSGTRPLARRRSGRIRAQRSFRRAWSFSSLAWPHGWPGRAGVAPAAPSFAAFIARPLHPASVHGNPSFVLIFSPSRLSPRSATQLPTDKTSYGAIAVRRSTVRNGLGEGSRIAACRSSVRPGYCQHRPEP